MQQTNNNVQYGYCGNDESTSNISEQNSNSNMDICRICHCEADYENPLLSPCYCAGTLKYVHQSCLRQWLATSDIKSCELCKFNFILQMKMKPLIKWRRLEMGNGERRRLLCAILFHFVAAVCVIWSLFVLIDRATEEVQKGIIGWPFWTKLVVVAVGFTGGTVFMYIQCRQYLHLFSRWKAQNSVIIVQNVPEKLAMPASTSNFVISTSKVPPTYDTTTQIPSEMNENITIDGQYFLFDKSTTMFQRNDVFVEELHDSNSNATLQKPITTASSSLNDIQATQLIKECCSKNSNSITALNEVKTDYSVANNLNEQTSLYKSLPNLKSSECLLIEN